jgi:hypothetical protein
MRRTLLIVAALSGAWAMVLIGSGGFELSIHGMRVRSNDAFRPLLLSVVALATYLAVAGHRTRQRWYGTLQRIPLHVVSLALAFAVFAIGVAYSTTVAAGADAYGYVSQADLWVSGKLRVAQPWVRALPWPDRGWTATPLGYKPLPEPEDWVIVPTYSPGLPLLMAGAKLGAGHAAMFWIVPLCGAVLMIVTYGIGARLGSNGAGLAGAWLTATSPPFLYTIILPWSDVPATTAWAAAFYFLLGRSVWNAAASGLAASAAVLIRPNLVWGVGVLGLWFLIACSRARGADRWPIFRAGSIYTATAIVGVLATGTIHSHLYGSPFESGYGRFSDNFTLLRIPSNILRYASWLWETRGALAFAAGIIAIAVPGRRVWPRDSDRTVFVPIGLFVLGVVAMYCSYLVFDGWPFLRFLLPAYPLVMISASAVALALSRSRGPGASLAVIGLLTAIGLFLQFQSTVKSGTFGLVKTERRYVGAAQLTREWTVENSVILSLGHSGTARYYGGRQTLRYDVLEPEWLDRSLAWLAERGVHPYALLEAHEVEDFQRRFDRQRAVRLTRANPLFRYDGLGTVLLFDLLEENRAPTHSIRATLHGTRSIPPAPPPRVFLR